MKITFISAFLFILSIRYAYQVNNPLYFYFPDSYQYLNRAQEIARGAPLIHFFRTPAYPLILKEILHLDGKFTVDLSTISWINYHPLVRFQFILGIFGALFFLYLAYRLLGGGWIFMIIAFLFGGNIHIFGWEKNILTESLTSATLLALLFSIVRLIESGKIIYFLLATIVSWILFLLRPVFFLFPISLTPIFLFYFLKKKTLLIAVTTLLFSLMSLFLPLYYASENQRLYGYYGITNILPQDLFAKVIQYHLDASAIHPDDIYTAKLKECINKHIPDTWVGTDECLSSLGIAGDYYFIHSSTVAGNFAKRIIMKHPFAYLLKTLTILPEVLISTKPDPFQWVSTYATSASLWRFWSFLDHAYNLIQKLMLAFYLFYPLSLFHFFCHPSKKNAILVILGTTIAYQIFFNSFFTQSDYVRLRNPVEPELLLFCFYYYFWLATKILIRYGKTKTNFWEYLKSLLAIISIRLNH